MGAGGETLCLALVLEQHLGHRTYGQNLLGALGRRSDVVVDCIPVGYAPTTRWWERIPSDGVRGALRGRTEVARGVAGDRADVRIFNTQVPAVIGPRAARARPYVLCTDVTPVQYDEMASGYGHRADRPGPLRWIKHDWNRRVLRGAAAHAPWSRWVADSLVVDYAVEPERISVIPPGIDTDTWRPRPRAPSPEEESVRFLFVGGDFHRKGGERLLAAFARVDDPAAELHVVTRSTLPRHPRVRVHTNFSPNDPGLRELFVSSDVFVLPSETETFGIAAVEAGAAGLPIVAATVGGLGDLVVDGVTGLSTSPGDTDSLADAMIRLAADPELRVRMGAAARRRAVEQFDADTNAGRLVDLVRRLVVPAEPRP